MKIRMDTAARSCLPTRRQILGGGAVFGVSLLPGFAGTADAETDEATLLAGMKQEGPPMIYTSMDPQMVSALVKAFKAKYGVEVDTLHLVSSPLAEKFSAEMQTGNTVADVLIVADTTVVDEVTAKKWVQAPSGIPALATWPKEAMYKAGIIGALNPHSIAWNTSLVPNGITKNEDLLDPSLKGRVLLADPRIEVALTQWYAMLIDAYGDEFLRKLGQQASFGSSAAAASQQLAAGSMAAFAPCANNPIIALKRQGAPIDQAFIPPTMITGFMGMVVAGAHRPNGARLFLNYWMSPEGQAVGDKGGFSPLPNIPGTFPMPKYMPAIPPDRMAKLTPKILGLLGAD